MEFKQIKEDWRVYKPNVKRPSVITVSGDNGCTDIYSAPKTNCTVEKAHLIAAAPDLYEVVRKALPLLKRSGYEIISIDAEYALKKACGEILEYIPINIWDDFYDDGYVPEGEKLETYIYVEDSNIPQEKRKKYLEILLEYINKNLNIDGIKLWMELYESRKRYPNLIGTEHERMFFDRWEIKLEGLTHERLHEWMKVLESVDIKVDGIPFHIYSGS